jgi:D-serine deaminase-like pyridoxal phosphate-dependent protein
MIIKPTLLLDKQKCKTNIAKMYAKATKLNIALRPHFKTHQSLEIGQWIKGVGVTKITVSSLEMAAYFAKEWNDITVAFPVNILEIDTINRLAEKITLNILIESKEAVAFLNNNLKSNVNFLIKINIGNNRAGLLPSNIQQIGDIIKTSEASDKLQFIGFLGHAGHTYKCKNKAAVLEIHKEAKDKIVSLKDKFKVQYPKIITSYGDTPSCSIAEDFSGIDEIRPGNYVFYDLMQLQIGACNIEDIAVAMACPIVAIHKDINEIVIYGGGIHFSKEQLEDAELGTIYGRIVKKNGSAWSDLIPEMYVKGLSQEHGVISVPDSEINNYEIGDTLIILPVHSCMTANLMKSYLTTEDATIKIFNPAN